MLTEVANLRRITDDRLKLNPTNHFYVYANTEVSRIEKFVEAGTLLDKAFYDSLTHGIGLMCARELEQPDPSFCDAVYGILEAIRVSRVSKG